VMKIEFAFWFAYGCVLAVPFAKRAKKDHIDALLAPLADLRIWHRSWIRSGLQAT
jgi:hypothetical protein